MRKFNFFIISVKLLISIVILQFMTGCDSLLKIDPPETEVLASDVFSSDDNASAAVVGMYSSMIGTSVMQRIGFGCSLSADESDPANFFEYPFTAFGTNNLTSSDSGVSDFWTGLYNTIYQANSIIENATKSSGMSDSIKRQYVAQAKFVRALNFFYLVNMFGPIPLTITTDMKTNNSLSRTSIDSVYTQIVSDLKDAEANLPVDYSNYSNKRDKPNSSAASALLAKVYLYMGDYINAEKKATEVIHNNLYELLPTSEIGNVFLKDSKETIFALNPQSKSGHSLTYEDYYYYYGNQYNSLSYVMTSSLINAFEKGDARKITWTGSFVSNDGNTYYYGAKYKDYEESSDPSEYSVVLRFAEQYLIRAEARAQQNNIIGAVEDINVIRTRAALAHLNAANMDQTQCLASIEQERRVELFLEYGNRWFDLKRTNRANAVLGALKPNTWKATDVLYPIPLSERKKVSQLTQNAGY
jgi:starch-binding outer membrane protein, SusD/RagB family